MDMTKPYLRATLWGLFNDFSFPLALGLLLWVLLVLGAYGVSYLLTTNLWGG